MSSFVLGSALLLGLLVPVIIRIFMKKRTHVDTAVVLVPVSLVILVIYICAFGVQFFTVLLTIVILFVFITNFRALQRFINGLYVDFFRIPFIISTVICGITILFLAFLLYWFAPKNDMDIILSVHDQPDYTVTRTLYTGTAYQGLSPRESVMERTSAVVTTYAPIKDDGVLPVIICVPDICVRAADYVPLMKVLADKGFICMAADITTPDTALFPVNGTWIRPFIVRVRRILYPDTFTEFKAEANQKKLLETEAFINAVKKQYPGRKIIVVADESSALIYRENIEGVQTLHLNTDGLGFLPLTQPLDAFVLMPGKYPYTARRASDSMIYEAAAIITGGIR